MPQITVRVSDSLAEALHSMPREGDRTISDDHRAGVEVIVALAQLAQLRADPSSRARSIDRVRDDLGRVLLGTFPRETRDVFYEWARTAPEVDPDRVLDWLAGCTHRDARDHLDDFDDADLIRARELISRALEMRDG